MLIVSTDGRTFQSKHRLGLHVEREDGTQPGWNHLLQPQRCRPESGLQAGLGTAMGRLDQAGIPYEIYLDSRPVQHIAHAVKQYTEVLEREGSRR